MSLDNQVGDERMSVLGPHLFDNKVDYEVWTATEHDNGIIGLLQSMHRLFTHCIKEGFESVLVLEDDSEFVVSFLPFIKEVWPQVPKDFHCLMLACTLCSRPERVSENILRIGSSYCTNAIVYSREAMQKIIPMIELNPHTAYDIVLMQNLQTEDKCYCTFPQMCFQREGYSSIEKKSMNWRQYQSEAWIIHTHNV